MAKMRNVFITNPQAGLVGVEIECEGEGLHFHLPKEWTSTTDGSLRGTYPFENNEFVLKKPLSVEDSERAVLKLYDHFEKFQSKLTPSFLTSVHIHRNVQDMDEVQVLNVIYTYYLFEEALVKYCGRARENNRFCLRLRDADEICTIMNDCFFKGLKQLLNYGEFKLRYAALNLAAIQKYGSIEFRAMRWTADPREIIVWMRLIDSIITFSTKRGLTPVKIREMFLNKGSDKLGETVFGEYFKYIVNPDFSHSVDVAHSLTIEFPFTFAKGVFVKSKKEVQLHLREGYENAPQF